MDEWTSIKNRRYLNICLLGDETIFYNLGMVYIPGKCGAVEIRALMESRLNDFNINFEKHIVGTITDGPNVMKKFVRESCVNGIFCLSHAIHLAVFEIFYKKKAKEPVEEEKEHSDADDYEDVAVFDDDNNETVEIHDNYKIVLANTRRIIKMCKKSPTKNCILQKYVVSEYKKEISLELDIVTRWNSLALKKFYKKSSNRFRTN